QMAGELGIGGDKTDYEVGGGTPILGPDGEPLTRDSRQTGGWVHQAAGAARGAISSVRDAGSAVLDRASKYSGYAGDAGGRARHASGQLAQKVQRDPWLIGVFGFVAGALIAALLPATRLEQESIGGARDELWNRATELGYQAADRVRELAESTTRAAHY